MLPFTKVRAPISPDDPSPPQPSAVAATVQRAGEKLDAHYAGVDSAAARRAGRLQ